MPQLDLEHPGTNPMVPRTQNSLMPNHNSPLPHIPNPQNDPRPPVQRAEVSVSKLHLASAHPHILLSRSIPQQLLRVACPGRMDNNQA
jgi:hypothetical protein